MRQKPHIFASVNNDLIKTSSDIKFSQLDLFRNPPSFAEAKMSHPALAVQRRYSSLETLSLLRDVRAQICARRPKYIVHGLRFFWARRGAKHSPHVPFFQLFHIVTTPASILASKISLHPELAVWNPEEDSQTHVLAQQRLQYLSDQIRNLGRRIGSWCCNNAEIPGNANRCIEMCRIAEHVSFRFSLYRKMQISSTLFVFDAEKYFSIDSGI